MKTEILINKHNGTIDAGSAKGERAIVLDYSLDGGKSWDNHGIYCREFLGKKLDKIIANLTFLAENNKAITSRSEQIFPVNCHPLV